MTLMTVEADRRELERLRLSLLSHRAANASICPSEVARAAEPDEWRVLMPAVRMAACRLAEFGLVEITQNGRPIDVQNGWRGPVRLRRGRLWESREREVAMSV
jgi:hypothetical protein